MKKDELRDKIDEMYSQMEKHIRPAKINRNIIKRFQTQRNSDTLASLHKLYAWLKEVYDTTFKLVDECYKQVPEETWMYYKLLEIKDLAEQKSLAKLYILFKQDWEKYYVEEAAKSAGDLQAEQRQSELKPS